jgi:hypothetical protein
MAWREGFVQGNLRIDVERVEEKVANKKPNSPSREVGL